MSPESRRALPAEVMRAGIPRVHVGSPCRGVRDLGPAPRPGSGLGQRQPRGTLTRVERDGGGQVRIRGRRATVFGGTDFLVLLQSSSSCDCRRLRVSDLVNLSFGGLDGCVELPIRPETLHKWNR